LDMIMLGMNGSDSYDQLKVIAPAFKVILSRRLQLKRKSRPDIEERLQGLHSKALQCH